MLYDVKPRSLKILSIEMDIILLRHFGNYPNSMDTLHNTIETLYTKLNYTSLLMRVDGQSAGLRRC